MVFIPKAWETESNPLGPPSGLNPTPINGPALVDLETRLSTYTDTEAAAAQAAAQAASDPVGSAAAAQAAAIAASAQALVPTGVKVSTYTAAAADFIPVDISGGTVPIALPNTPPDKTRIGVKVVKISGTPGSTSCTIAVNPSGPDVFNITSGSVLLTLSALFQGVLLQYKASTHIWYVSTADTPLNTPLGAAKLGTNNKVGGAAGSALDDSVLSDTRGSAQNQTLAFGSLTGKFSADAGVYSARGDRGISVTNQMVDPRGTTAANWSVGTGGGVTVQAPTNRVDGYQQQATPLSCQEAILTPAGGGSTIGLFSNLRANGNGVFVTPALPLVALRLAAKLTGTLGSAWRAELIVQYYNSATTFLSNFVIWSGGPSSITLGEWFIAEGFDCQMPDSTAYLEFGFRVIGSTGGNPVTIRCTEFVVVIDPDGDVPGYVGGDVAIVGRWLGTADQSASRVNFDPVATYPTKNVGATDAGSHPGVSGVTARQAAAMIRSFGGTAHRVDLSFSGGNPAAPLPPASTVTWLQALIAAGIKPVLLLGAFPAWMAPTHMPLLSGNGGSITSGATSLKTSAAAPANITMPFDILIDFERLTVTAGATGTTWTVTRGVGGTSNASHNDGAQLTDYLFNAAFGHLYYPDSGYRATYATAITNLIATLGAANIAGVELWNEPNLTALDTRNEGAAGYSAFLNAIYTPVKAAYPSVKILGGVLAVQADAGAGVVIAETFLAGMFSAGALYDYLDCHFYTSGTAQVATSAPGTGLAGFDQSIKRIKDQLLASGAGSTPIYVSETGQVADQPDERRQAQAVALCFGRLWRDPQIVGIHNNGLVNPSDSGSHGGGLFDMKDLRPRASAHQLAAMTGLYRFPLSRADSALADALMPWTLTIVPLLASVDAIYVQGTWIPVLDTAASLNGYVSGSTAAQYDEIAWDLALAAGNYTFALMYLKNASYGIFTVLLDGVSVGTIDAYAASLARNVTSTLTFTVGSTGRHRLSFRAATKNASSSGYKLIFQIFQLRRTA